MEAIKRYRKHRDDYAGGRRKGAIMGGNARYNRSRPSRKMGKARMSVWGDWRRGIDDAFEV